MTLLENVRQPRDLDGLTPQELERLGTEIREFLVQRVSATGGHLGPNLGVVELTLALHRTFDSPRDLILWDTGHQSYVHKIVTGRADQFDTLRQTDGLSGYPCRAESPHDVIENSHASTALSYADGIAKAWSLQGDLARVDSPGRHIVAVVGDGALTGGMSWEALNNIAGSDRQVIIVVNDNARSYAPTKGGLADHLATLRTTRGYENVLDWGRNALSRTPLIGGAVYGAVHGMKKGIKDMVAPQGLFEDLGLKYVGPVDGHDVEAVESALRKARSFGGPVLVHVMTHKGKGYRHARANEADRFHAVDKINPETGLPLQVKGRIWTDEFADEIVEIGHDRPEVVAVTAAMLIPVGLEGFAARFPDRVFDVGIAEQHALTMAAGLSYAGLHPVVCIYATFLNRAFDQLLMDCALHRAGVTVVLDRAGVTGTDGGSHNGMWDLTITGIMPGVRVTAPRDAVQLRRALREAVAINDGPTVLRFSKQNPPPTLPATRVSGSVDILAEPSGGDVDLLLVGIGEMAAIAVEVAGLLTAEGRSVRVIDPRWSVPVSPDVVQSAAAAGAVAVIEDGIVVGGVGSQIAYAVREAGLAQPVFTYGIPRAFLEHAARGEILTELGLTPAAIASSLTARMSP